MPSASALTFRGSTSQRRESHWRFPRMRVSEIYISDHVELTEPSATALGIVSRPFSLWIVTPSWPHTHNT